VRMALRDQREYVEKIYFCLSRWPEMLSVDEKIIDRITEAVYSILNGKAPVPLDLPSGYPDNEISNHAHRTWYEEAPSKGAKNIAIFVSSGVKIFCFKVIATDGMLKPQ